MNTQIKISKVQRAIQEVIECFINRRGDLMKCNREDKYSASKGLMYCFHDNKSMAVDGDLYDILYYGHADYNYGHELYIDIHNTATKYGHYLEYEGQGIYNIVKS